MYVTALLNDDFSGKRQRIGRATERKPVDAAALGPRLREVYMDEIRWKLAEGTVVVMNRISPVILALTVGVSACSGDTARSGSQTASSVIAADGSSTVFPATEAVAEEFQRANPGTRVTVGSSGTSGGFQKFCR